MILNINFYFRVLILQVIFIIYHIEIHLNRNNSKAKFIVIFSDLGSLLNINEFDVIEGFANKYNFKITNKIKENSKYRPKNMIEPLKNFKKESQLYVYEMQRV